MRCVRCVRCVRVVVLGRIVMAACAVAGRRRGVAVLKCGGHLDGISGVVRVSSMGVLRMLLKCLWW